MALTPSQERFCAEYVVDLNGSAAYRRAYPKARSEKVSRVNASKLLARPEIQARVTALKRAREERTEVTADWALRRLKREAEYEGEGASHAARVSALNLAMKHLGMLKEDAPHPDRPAIDLRSLTDDALDRIIAAAGPLLGAGLGAIGGAREGAPHEAGGVEPPPAA